MKRPTGWEVTDGDTGRRDVSASLPGGSAYLRRQGGAVTLELSNVPLTKLQVFFSPPDGFHLTSASALLLTGLVGKASTYSNVVAIYMAGGSLYPRATDEVRGIIQWTTQNVWPTTLPGEPT